MHRRKTYHRACILRATNVMAVPPKSKSACHNLAHWISWTCYNISNYRLTQLMLGHGWCFCSKAWQYKVTTHIIKPMNYLPTRRLIITYGPLVHLAFVLHFLYDLLFSLIGHLGIFRNVDISMSITSHPLILQKLLILSPKVANNKLKI